MSSVEEIRESSMITFFLNIPNFSTLLRCIRMYLKILHKMADEAYTTALSDYLVRNFDPALSSLRACTCSITLIHTWTISKSFAIEFLDPWSISALAWKDE